MDEKNDIKMSNVDKMLGAGIYGDNKLEKFDSNTGGGNIANFDYVKAGVDEIARKSIDYTLKRKDIDLIEKDGNLMLLDKGKDQAFPFSNHALSQICSTAGVPAYYIKKCMGDNDFELVLKNMRKWFEKLSPEKEMLLRTTDGRIHGVLSNRYGIFDDSPLLQIINDTIGKHGDFVIKNFMANPESMNLRIIANKQIDVAGEDLSIGLNIKNSRVGTSAVDVQFLMFKWACTNGTFFGGGKGEFYNKRHTGIEYEQVQNGLVEVLEKMPSAVLKIKEWVEAAKENKLTSKEIERLLKEFERDTGNNKLLTGRVLDLLPTYGGNAENSSRWSIVQAMTEASQIYSIDTRESIDKYAGFLLQKKAA